MLKKIDKYGPISLAIIRIERYFIVRYHLISVIYIYAASSSRKREPYTNKRDDKFGGSFEKRLTIMQEIIAGIRAQCGPDYPISVRISADEFVEGGLKIEDTIEIAKCLKELGIPVLAAGDANVPGRIMEATLDAVNLAYGFLE